MNNSIKKKREEHPKTQWRAIIGDRNFVLAYPKLILDRWAQPGTKDTVSTRELSAWAKSKGKKMVIDENYPITYKED